MISKLAYVSGKAQLGANVTVEPFAYIADDVIVGDGCWIGPGAVLMDGARLGRNCQVHTAAVVAGIPQDLKFKGEYTTAEVGDNTMIRESVTISRGTAAKGKTVVGSNVLLMAYVHVGHDCVVGDRCILANRVSLGGEVEIDDWAILGGHCAVHQFSRIGAHVMVSGGSLISKDIPPFVTAAHNPLSFVGINSIGLRRRDFTNEQIEQIQEMCRILFQSGYSYTKGCELVEREMPQGPERDMMLSFSRKSKRGIIKPYNPRKKNEDIG